MGLADLSLEVTTGEASWSMQLPPCAPWAVTPPTAEAKVAVLLENLRQASTRALRTREDGSLTPNAAGVAASLEKLAESIGAILSERLLSPEARALLGRAVKANLHGSPPLLRIRVREASLGALDQRETDAALALPWELLRLDGRFPVKEGRLDVVREVVIDGLPGLDAPTRDLTVVATVAAPVDALRLSYEAECYRLWKALGEEERRFVISHTGTVDELVSTIANVEPVAWHFTGHGEPGYLVFEDASIRSDRMAVQDLVLKLRGEKKRDLPRLAYLASCHGASHRRGRAAAPTTTPPASARNPGAPSSAATLHAAGFPQVLAYFGPVGDQQSTRVEAHFYRTLVEGGRARDAVRAARLQASQPLTGPHGACTHLYPLGWTQLVLYHRGADLPTATPSKGLKDVEHGSPLRRSKERVDRAVTEEEVPRLRHGFIGRRGPRGGLIGGWREGRRAAVVAGLGGLGKTALCTEVLPALAAAQGLKADQVIVLNGRAAAVADDAMAALWTQLQAFRSSQQWSDCLAAAQVQNDRRQAAHQLTASSFVNALAWLRNAEGSTLLYLDDAESLQVSPSASMPDAWKTRELARLWSSLLELAAPGGHFGFLASTRYVPRGTPAEARVPLEQMPNMDVVRLLRWFPTLSRLPAADAAWLTEEVLDGHPRTVEYLEDLVALKLKEVAGPGAQYNGGRWRQDILMPILRTVRRKVHANLLLGKLWHALPESSREHLGRCSVLASHVPWDAIVHLGKRETADQLLQMGLLSPGPMPGLLGQGWAPHGTVVTHVQAAWKGDFKDAHRSLGRWCARELGARDSVYLRQQAIEHLCAGGAASEAWPVAQPLVLSLRQAGRYREALRWARLVASSSGAEGEVLGMALAFEGQLGQLVGESPEQVWGKLKRAEPLVPESSQAFVLHTQAWVVEARGDLPGARRLLERSIEVNRRVLGTDEHPDIAAALHELAWVLQSQGDLPGARRLLERSLKMSRRVLGTEHDLDVASSLHALAGVLQSQGDFSGARRLLERTINLKKQILGTEQHPGIAASLHELARVLQSQGDLPGARRLLERSIDVNRRAFGTEEHPYVAASLHELARVFQAQGDLTGARRLLERSIDVNKRVLGTEVHPDIAASLNALAEVFQAQGDLTGARRLLERSIDVNKRVLGTEVHPDVAASLHALAGVLQAQGDLPGARRLLERSIKIKKRVLGTEEHLDIAASLHELARVLHAQGDLPGARQLLERSIKVRTRVLGTEEHPEIAASLHQLARVVHAQDDLQGARQLLERSMEINKRLLGTEEHPAVAASLHELARVLHAQGDLQGARRLLERSIEVNKRVLGTEVHPSVAASFHELARVLQAQGDIQSVRRLLERVLEIELQIYGTRDHYLTAMTEVYLAMILQMEDAAPGAPRAAELLLHAFSVFSTQLGPEHPETRGLAEYLRQIGLAR
jgi:tetratricopeptide (TPR) repeat protein